MHLSISATPLQLNLLSSLHAVTREHLMLIVTSLFFATVLMTAFSKLILNRSAGRRSFSSFMGLKDATNVAPIETKILHYLSNDCKISANSFVLISVSGGLDSMAMLHILHSISESSLPMNLEVISFNHKLRSESDEEVDQLENSLLPYDLTAMTERISNIMIFEFSLHYSSAISVLC